MHVERLVTKSKKNFDLQAACVHFSLLFLLVFNLLIPEVDVCLLKIGTTEVSYEPQSLLFPTKISGGFDKFRSDEKETMAIVCHASHICRSELVAEFSSADISIRQATIIEEASELEKRFLNRPYRPPDGILVSRFYI